MLRLKIFRSGLAGLLVLLAARNLSAADAAPASAPGAALTRTFSADHGRYRFLLDATDAPDLLPWAEKELRPVVQEWYPRLVEYLPGEGFQPRTNLTIRFRTNMNASVPAAAGGGFVHCNAQWFRRELNREARGAVVHELVHVVQSYPGGRNRGTGTRMPGWLVEGIADYIRWFLYEPGTRGAEITARNLAQARYDASYRITGHFLDWASAKYDPLLVRKLNAAGRTGQYREDLWKDITGRPLAELGADWRREQEARVAARQRAVDPVRRTNNLLVINYDPVLRGQGGTRLRQHLRWNDPRPMTTNLVRHIRESSGGYAHFRLVDWIDVDAFPLKRDGFRYTEQSFLEMWKDKRKAHQPDAVSYAAIFSELNLAERVRREDITEVWVWGAPYFGTDEYAMKIPGDQVYYQTDNPWFYRPYDIPDCGRTVWVMGFNYEVGEDNALHSFGHRCEGILSLTVGGGVWDGAAGGTNLWSRYTRQADKFPDAAEVGNVHGGPNARGGYDYGQTNLVWSGAEDWFNYPAFTGLRTRVNSDTWGRPHHLNFQKWWLGHLPRYPGSTNGIYNNWWRYVVDYDNAVRGLPPPGGRLQKPRRAMY